MTSRTSTTWTRSSSVSVPRRSWSNPRPWAARKSVRLLISGRALVCAPGCRALTGDAVEQQVRKRGQVGRLDVRRGDALRAVRVEAVEPGDGHPRRARAEHVRDRAVADVEHVFYGDAEALGRLLEDAAARLVRARALRGEDEVEQSLAREAVLGERLHEVVVVRVGDDGELEVGAQSPQC